MTTMSNTIIDQTLYVIHPLDDVQEQKRSAEGRLQMSASVKASLIVLRCYLAFITALALYRIVSPMLHR